MEHARLHPEFFEREAELTDQEFRLYCRIVFHSFVDKRTGLRICPKTVDDLCRIYSLDKQNTYRRLKRMRTGEFQIGEKPQKVAKMKSPWIKKTEDGILPLVGVTGVNSTLQEVFESVNFTPKRTKKKCKYYTKKDKKSVNITPALKEYQNSLQNDIENTQNGSARAEIFELKKSSGGRSNFTVEQIYAYACEQSDINNPRAFAVAHHRTGESDSFVAAFLKPVEAGEPSELNREGKLADELTMLREMQEMGGLEDFEKYYSEEDWQWLMKNL